MSVTVPGEEWKVLGSITALGEDLQPLFCGIPESATFIMKTMPLPQMATQVISRDEDEKPTNSQEWRDRSSPVLSNCPVVWLEISFASMVGVPQTKWLCTLQTVEEQEQKFCCVLQGQIRVPSVPEAPAILKSQKGVVHTSLPSVSLQLSENVK